MKTYKKRQRIHLGVESSFFPRARKAMEERQRAQGTPPSVSEPRQKHMWDVLQTPPAGTPAVEHPEIMRPGYQPRAAERVEPSEAFAVPKMWAYVDHKRRAPGYTPQNFVVDFLTPPVTAGNDEQIQMGTIGEIAMFFGIPAAAFRNMTIEQAWNQVIFPMFRDFEDMMNRDKPAYIPGFLSFDFSPDHELAIVYYDR